MKKYVLLLVALLVFVMPFTAIAQEQAVVDRLQAYNLMLPQGYGVTSVENAIVFLEENPDALLLDVREIAEYEAGHIENAFNVPIRTLSQNLALLPDLDAPILVICKGGARATLAATSLGILGYNNVKILAGGYDAWVGAELTTTLDPFTVEAGTAPEFDPTVFAAVDAYLTTLPEGFGFVSPQNAVVELTSDTAPVLLDVRSLDEWNSGYIEGAQHIWINEFMMSRDQWPVDLDTPVIIYCASGYRGSIATVIMRLMGYTNVRNLSGGLRGWQAAGFPLVGVPAAELDVEALLADYVAGLPGSFNAVRVADLATELAAENDLVLVDVRAGDDYTEGTIPGAINIRLEELAQHLDLLPDQSANIVVFCASGHRSAIGMVSLNLLGYANVRSLVGGFGQWSAGGNAVSTEATVVEPAAAPAVDEAVFTLVDGFLSSLPAGYYTVKPIDLQVELAGDAAPITIDVRTQSERDGGFIADSLFIPLNELMTRVAEWPQDKAAAIVVYDNPTHRSTITLVAMRLLGYENVRALAGGIGGWTSNQLPLVTE